MSAVLTRHDANPILTRADIPDAPPAFVDVTSVFNPGATVYRGRDVLLLRVQSRGRETCFMVAQADRNGGFTVSPGVVRLEGPDGAAGTVYHAYDARITPLEGAFYIMFAMDTDRGCRLGLARTDDFSAFEVIGMTGAADVRNGVLFPERVGGRYLRLERPNRLRFENGVTSGDEIVLAESDDLIEWRSVATVMRGRPHYWDELIGPGPPPVRTSEGWLLVYHGVATHGRGAVYQAGVVLLDLDDPSKVVARCSGNILEPREPCEIVGQVPNVVFPCGMVVDALDAEGSADRSSAVRLYYGAADTCVCMATGTIGGLLDACGR